MESHRNQQAEYRQFIDDLIETELTKHIDRIGCTEAAVLVLSEIVEHAYHDDPITGDNLLVGLSILIRAMHRRGIKKSEEKEVADVHQYAQPCMDALLFAMEFYSLQEFIYFSHALPESVTWLKTVDGYKVKLNDRSIFRQYVGEKNSFAANSMDSRFAHIASSKQIIDALKDSTEFDFTNPKVSWCLQQLDTIMLWKLENYNSYLPESSTINIHPYPYCDYVKVLKELLAYALYQRYFTAAKKISAVICLPESDFAAKCAEATGVDEKTVCLIMKDIAKCSQATFIQLPVRNAYYLLPFAFSLQDMISNRLRLFATQKPNAYSATVAGIMGKSLVRSLKELFLPYRNFKVRTEISLNKFSTLLPDIDLMTISYEPSLGFHVMLCEVKNPLPATWAKEYLKAVETEGFLKKAIEQTKKVNAFINTEEGAAFFRQQALSLFPELDMHRVLPSGFCMIFTQVIITSQSVGMFYAHENMAIVNDALFRQAVYNCDGDINYILAVVRGLASTLDSSFEIKEKELSIGGYSVTVDRCSVKHFLKFTPNTYLSDGSLEKLEREAIETGYSFINGIARPAGTDMLIIDPNSLKPPFEDPTKDGKPIEH